MPIDEAQLKRDIMSRVRAIYFLRMVANPLAVKIAVLAACAVSAVFLVSIPHFVDNMSRLPSMMLYFPYLFGAFMHTSFIVQAVLILATASVIWLLVDTIRNVGIPFLRPKSA